MVDFKRINDIKRVIETDYDAWTGEEVKSEAKCVLRYQFAMSQVLALPVPTRDEPAPICGEIDSAARTATEEGKTVNDMWNGNQGNGQGNGYGAQSVYDGLNSTRSPGGARFPFIEEGRHKLALCTLEEFQHATDGPSARALFEVIESNKHPVGSFVVKIWKLIKPPKFQGQMTDGEQFTDFCRKLKGAPQDYVMGNDIRILMKDRANDQLARGSVIECNGVPNQKRTWVNLYWSSIPQSAQDIATMRQRLETKGIPASGGTPQQQGGPAFYQQQGGGQFQGTPHPAQNPAYGVPQQALTGYGAPAPQGPAPIQGAPQGWGQPAAPQQNPYPGAGPNDPFGNRGNNGGNGTW